MTYVLFFGLFALTFAVMLAGLRIERPYGKWVTWAGVVLFGALIAYVLLVALGVVQYVSAQEYTPATSREYSRYYGAREPQRAGMAATNCTTVGERSAVVIIRQEGAPALAAGDFVQAPVPSTLGRATPVCAGEARWNDSTNVALTVWEDDPLTEEIDGYTAGDEYVLRLLLAGTLETVPLEFEVVDTSGIGYGPGYFVAGGGITLLENVTPVAAPQGVEIGWADSALVLELPPGADAETYETHFEAPLELAVVGDSLGHLRIGFEYHDVSSVGLEADSWRRYSNREAISYEVLAAGLGIPPGYYLEALSVDGRVRQGGAVFITEAVAVTPSGRTLPVEITQVGLPVELRRAAIRGDVTGPDGEPDGQVDTDDLRAVARLLLEQEDFSQAEVARMDLNRDNVVSLADFALLYRLAF